jgi:hypothetical protein
LLGIFSRGRGEWGRGLNVIVCPGPANDGPDQVDQVDRTRAAHLALDFAQHVPDIERNEIAEPVLAACLEYVEAAHEAIDCGEVPPRLPEAKERFVARRARWEEARRQVLHILATEPGPRGEAG